MRFNSPPLLLVFIILFVAPSSVAQLKVTTNDNKLRTQIGVSLKSTIELGFLYVKQQTNASRKPNPIIHLAADAGVGSQFAVPWLYPSFNLELQLYNGGHGSRRNNDDLKKPVWNIDLVAAFTMTGGVRNNLMPSRFQQLQKRQVPLYYFSNFVYPALNNPYDWSLSLGTDLIFPLTDKKKKKQRVGFINGHFYPVQISYYNDGGVPVSDIYLGDRRDRFYTGNFMLSYHGKRNTALELVEVSYFKFTGYTKNAFELSNQLYLNTMNYHDTAQQSYNKSIWKLHAASLSKGIGFSITNYDNVRADVQHWIHWSLNNAYHVAPNKPHWSVSASYYYDHIKTGLQ